MATLELSSLAPDHDQILEQIQTELASRGLWEGSLSSPTAQAFAEIFAAIGTADRVAILRSVQDCFPDTVISDNAAYALADYQGIRLPRKLPASAVATFTTTTAVVIPAYTQFESNGNLFFNRESLFLQPGVTTTATLHEGEVLVVVTPGLGEDYARFVSREYSFAVSDTDVIVYLNGNQIPRVTDGIWTLRGKPGFKDRTLPDGRLAIEFGTSILGTRPSTVDSLSILYTVTLGSAGNEVSTAGKIITCTSFPDTTATFTSACTGGTDETPAYVFKNVSAPTFGSFSSAVTKQQHLDVALSYPEVVDAAFYSQREVNPHSLAWMNLIRVVLLTSVPWNATKKQAFLDYLQDRAVYVSRFFLEDAAPVSVNIDLKVYCYSWANLTSIQQKVQNNIAALFVARRGLIGYDLYTSDIAYAIRSADSGVEYFEIVSPSTNVITSIQAVAAPTATVLSSGSLASGNYVYGIGVAITAGIVTAHSFAEVTVATGGSSVQLSWTPVAGATNYFVYGRSENDGLYVIAVLDSSTLSFTDDGTTITTIPIPPQDQTTVSYIAQGTTSIAVNYSSRSGRRA
jgi:hypothetical protein